MIYPELPFPLVCVGDSNRPSLFFKLDLSNSFKIDSDTQMYLCSCASIFYVDWDFPLSHMSMDLSCDLAALASNGVPLVNATNIQVASRQGCSSRPSRP